jgi:carbamoyltransferase
MAWLNSDDLLLPGALASIADHFVSHPETDVVYGDRILIDEEGMEIGRWILPSHDDAVLSWVDLVPQETLFWRRSIWDKTGGSVDETFQFAIDWDLIIRFREAGARFVHLPRFIGAFRVHSSQKSTAMINDVGYREMDRIRKRILGYIPDPSEFSRAIRPYIWRHVKADLQSRLKQRFITSERISNKEH